MKVDAILFDVNGTVMDILTDEGILGIYRKMRNFFYYQGIYMDKEELRDLYYKILKEQKSFSAYQHAEFDAVEIWRKIIELKQTPFTKSLPKQLLEGLPYAAAHLYRSASLCRKLQTYPDVIPVLEQLKQHYRLGVVTNGQSLYATPELASVGLLPFFDPIIVSGDFGYCKPNPLLFQKALDHLKVPPENVIFVGNDMRHDVVGAKHMGMKVVFFASNQGDQTPCGVEPDYIIREFKELPTAITFIEQNH